MAEKIHDRLSVDLPINSVVSIAIVDDPFSNVGEKIKVLRSTRDDPLAGMYARKYIDDAQLAAGRKWQSLHDQAEIGRIRAIDPTKEAVDGRKIPEPITDHQIRAMRHLEDASKWLGRDGYDIVFTVLSNRKSIKEAAESHGYETPLELKYFGMRFRECLEALAKLWGYA